MATPSSPSKGRIRSDAMGSTSPCSRLRCQQRFSSSSMTPVPWAAYWKQRHYGDRSPASYTSIRSTTFAESHPALLTRNALEARFRFSIGLRGVVACDVLKNHFRMFNFIQTPIANGCTLLAIEPLSQGDRAFNSTYLPEPIRVSVRSLRNMSDERKHHANAFNARRRIAEASAAMRSRWCRRNDVCWLLLGWLVARQHR